MVFFYFIGRQHLSSAWHFPERPALLTGVHQKPMQFDAGCPGLSDCVTRLPLDVVHRLSIKRQKHLASWSPPRKCPLRHQPFDELIDQCKFQCRCTFPKAWNTIMANFWNVANPKINTFLPELVMLMSHLKPHLRAMFELGLRIRFWSEFFGSQQGQA